MRNEQPVAFHDTQISPLLLFNHNGTTVYLYSIFTNAISARISLIFGAHHELLHRANHQPSGHLAGQ